MTVVRVLIIKIVDPDANSQMPYVMATAPVTLPPSANVVVHPADVV